MCSFIANLSFSLGQASRDEPHFGTSYVEKAALALEEKLRCTVESLHLPDSIEGQAWVRQGEELGQGLKEQLTTLLHDASARIDWTDLKSVTSSLSSLQQGQQQNLDRMLSSLSATAGEACVTKLGFQVAIMKMMHIIKDSLPRIMHVIHHLRSRAKLSLLLSEEHLGSKVTVSDLQLTLSSKAWGMAQQYVS